MSNYCLTNSHSGSPNMIMIGDSHVTRLTIFNKTYHRINQTPIDFYRFFETTIPISKTLIKTNYSHIFMRKWVLLSTQTTAK